MDKAKRRKYQRFIIVLGLIFMALPQGLQNFWGNLTVYVYSYFMSCGQLTSQTPWVISIYFISRTLGLLLQASLRDLIGHPMTAVAGILLCSLGFFLTFVTVQISIIWLTVTVGILYGFGTGVINGWMFQLAVDFADRNVGFLVSLILASVNAGGMIVNQLITVYINPSNWQTDLDLQSGKYFTRKEVVDKVPDVFIVIGCFTIGTQVLGFCFVECALCMPKYFNSFHYEELIVVTDRRRTYYKSVVESGNNSEDVNQDKKSDNSMRQPTSCTSSTVNGNSISSQETAQPEKENTPMIILKTGLFYAIWLTFFFSELPFILLSNYYKLFGQLRISNDNFLTIIGSTRMFCDTWGRILWGALMDKLGVKNTMLTITLSLTITLTWYYFTLLVNKWLFFIMTLIFSNLTGAWFTCYVSLATALYGKKNVTTNLGLLKSSTLVLNLLAPPFFDFMLTNGGWFYTFISTGIITFVGFIIILAVLPNNI